MSVPNDPQLVPPVETKEVNKGRRPFWVSLAVIVFLLFGLIGGCQSVQNILKMGSVDWASNAQRLDTDINTLKWMTYFQEYGTLALSIFILVLCAGMWSMKKWGAVLSVIWAVICLGTTLFYFLMGRSVDLAVMVFYGVFVLVAVGEILLWRKGRLS